MAKTRSGYEVLDPAQERKGNPLPVPVKKKRGEVVPYARSEHLPALLPGALGDLDAYIRAANAAPMLSAEEERDLARRLREKGDLDAAQKLTFSHLRLVISVARGYLGYGLAHADLIQEGNIGLMKAIKHFDPEKGVRLTTYATTWIKAEIQEYIIRNYRMVKLATTKNQRKLFFNLRQMREDEKSLSLDEAGRIAQTLEVKPEEVLDMQVRLSGADTPLEGPSGESEDEERFAPIDWLTRDEDTPTSVLQEKARDRLSSEGLARAMDVLDERSREVIFARYLNEDGEGNLAPKTLQELATRFGVSIERVRQIEKKAIQKMHEALKGDSDIIEG